MGRLQEDIKKLQESDPLRKEDTTDPATDMAKISQYQTLARQLAHAAATIDKIDKAFDNVGSIKQATDKEAADYIIAKSDATADFYKIAVCLVDTWRALNDHDRAGLIEAKDLVRTYQFPERKLL